MKSGKATRIFRSAAATTLIATVLSPLVTANAALLLYEPFDYATGGIAGASGTSEIGFDIGSSWSENSARVTNIDSGSLSFGSMATVGNRFRYQVFAGNTDNANANRPIDVSVSSGDVWMSFLLHNDTLTARLKGGVYVTGTGGTEFGTFSAPPGGSTNNAKVQLYYNANSAEGNSISDASGTNLWVIKYTGLGSASGGTATMWIIDATDYNTIAPGGATEAELDANNIMKVTQTLAVAAAAFDADELLRFYLYDNGSGDTHYELDEIRIADTANEALAIVIPTPAALPAGLALLIALGARRRR